MIKLLEQAIEQFRMGMEGSGSAAFIRFIDAFQKELAREQANMQLESLMPFLQQIIQAQSRGDYLHVADLLEYEIQPLLQGR